MLTHETKGKKKWPEEREEEAEEGLLFKAA